MKRAIQKNVEDVLARAIISGELDLGRLCTLMHNSTCVASRLGPDFMAVRPLKRAIQKNVEDVLARAIISGELDLGRRCTLMHNSTCVSIRKVTILRGAAVEACDSEER